VVDHLNRGVNHLTNRTDSQVALREIWGFGGLDDSIIEEIKLTGLEPMLPSVYKTGVAAQATIAASALSAAEIWNFRTGRSQDLSVDMKHAAIGFRSERYTEINGDRSKTFASSGISDDPSEVHGFYKCGDGGWLQIHGNYPAHKFGVIEAFDCEPTKKGVQDILSTMTASDAEIYLTGKGFPAAMMRTLDEWSEHPQGQAVSALPLMEIEKIGDAKPLQFSDNPKRPLEGIKVLELTKVLAGPLIGRTLAEHGANVLWLNAPHLDVIDGLIMDMAKGKYPAHLDLDDTKDKSTFTELTKSADVFIQGYRPGSIASKGFSPYDMAEIRPGIVCVEISAFSHEGPWSDRRGFDSIVQTVSGIGREGGLAKGQDGMLHLPCQALDHGTGYLGAFGAMAGLLKQRHEGGSWRVRLSLAQTGHWLKSLGRLDAISAPDIKRSEISGYLSEVESPYGNISFTTPVAQLSDTPGYWSLPPSPFGSYQPRWQ
tara:strand:+ start:88 stop:1542 length:1455 start_codon:yes stop_codon:yes gene_type:complete